MVTALLVAIARGQHGLITRRQALACGASPGQIKRWLATGWLEVVHSGVYRIAGSPRTWEQQVLAAVLAAGDGAAASHRSAARLWGIGAGDDDVAEVTVPRGRRPRLDGPVVHQVDDIAARPLHLRRAVPTADPARTLVDLGAVLPAPAVEDALDRALVRRLVTVAGVEAALDQLARRGREGVGVLRRLLDERALGAERPDGLLEPRMARLLRCHDLPAAAFQHDVFDGGRFVARVDFAYPDRRLAIEVDGWDSHGSPGALQSDLARQNTLVALGWTILRFTWPDVVRHPGVVAATVGRVLAG